MPRAGPHVNSLICPAEMKKVTDLLPVQSILSLRVCCPGVTSRSRLLPSGILEISRASRITR